MKKLQAGLGRKPSLLRFLLYWPFIFSIWAGIALALVIGYEALQLPPIDQLSVPKRPPNIAILSETGVLLANRGSTGGANLRLADLPPFVPKAFIAIEDRRFYSHFGVDPLGILRAMTRNIAGGGAVQGGSTLTQQLAKNLFLTRERTFSRKIQEALLALWLEHKYSKKEILELYLNRVYFGSGSYGIEAAAQKYFGHSGKNLSLAEAAMLAGLMKAPSKLAPDRHLKAATERASQVIGAMEEEGFITPSLADLARSQPAKPSPDTRQDSLNYAADAVMDALDDAIGPADEDVVVTSTINAQLQADGEKALTEELDRKGGKYGVTQGALVAIDPSGAVKALVGGRNYAQSQFDRATSAKRQPGSAFKPFVYLTALEKGLTPESVRDDAPISIKGWQPENYSHQYFGPVTLARALSLSLNTVAVRLGQEVGPNAVIRTAHRLGIASDLEANASIALGTSEVTPLEITNAYVPFANGGVAVQAHLISRVKTAKGRLLYQRKGASNGRVIDASSLAMMNAMMEQTLLAGTARKAELPGWQAAGKTGTSQDWRDAWFIGYTSHLVTGVWLGNDDNSPTKKASGGNLPVEIWSRFMKVAHLGIPPQPLPGGIWQPHPAAPSLISLIPNISPGPTDTAAAPLPVPPAQELVPQTQRQPTAPPIRRNNDFLPPGLIPASGQSSRHAGSPQPQPSFFEQLFGGG